MKKPLILLAILALTTGAIAQENAAKLALAREAISAMQADKMFDGLVGQMKQMATQSMPLSATATPEERQKAEQLQTKIIDLSLESAKGMIAKMDHIYAEIYSEAELGAMKTFFLSSEGKSMLAKQPQVMAKLMPLVQDMQRDLMPKMQALMQEAKGSASTPIPAAAPAAKATVPASKP